MNQADYARNSSGIMEKTRQELIRKVAYLPNKMVDYYKRKG
jgi:hypothetical protein